MIKVLAASLLIVGLIAFTQAACSVLDNQGCLCEKHYKTEMEAG